MRSVRKALICCLAVFAFGAVMASAAQAKTPEGPFYKTEPTTTLERLLTGKTAPIEVAASATQILSFDGVTVTCAEEVVASGAEFDGSTGENAGKSKETVEYKKCQVTGNGPNCTVKEPIVAKVTNELGYAEKETVGTEEKGKGQLYTIFKPETSTTFTTLHFSAECTRTGAFAVEVGSGDTGIIAEDLNEAGEKVEVGKHETSGEIGKTKFPTTTLTPIWVESNGKLTELKGGSKVDGIAFKFEGTTNIKLTSHKKWGVFT